MESLRSLRRPGRSPDRRPSSTKRSPLRRRSVSAIAASSASSPRPSSTTRSPSWSGSSPHRTRVETYARLRQAADSSDQARGALVQKVRERNTQIETELLFFDLEWSALDDDVAERLLADPALEHYASVLRSDRRYKPYQLSEPEERISAEKERHRRRAPGAASSTSSSPSSRVSLDGERLSLDEALAQLARLTDQDERGRVAEAVTETLRPGLRTRGYVLNTILNERAIEDRLRGYDTLDLGAEPLERDPGRGDAEPRRRDRGALRHPAALLRAQGAAARPAAAAGLRPLRAAPGGRRHDRLGRRAGARARAFTDFSPPLADDRSADFFEQEWIDAAVRPGKMLGAFCATLDPGRAPVRADELRRRAAERADARARARPRAARLARAGSRAAERRARR